MTSEPFRAWLRVLAAPMERDCALVLGVGRGHVFSPSQKMPKHEIDLQ